MSNTITNVLIIGGIAFVAWALIGFPTSIPDLKTDIENIKQELGGPAAAPPAATAQPAASPDATAPATVVPQAGAGGFSGDTGSDGSDQPDDGASNGTSAPAPDPTPRFFTEPQAPIAPAPPAVHKTIPPVHHQIAGKPVAKVVHTPPHSVKKTHPKKKHKEEYGKKGGHYLGTRGYYTKKGHHHCTRGTPGCVCTDASKCRVGSNFAYSFYTGNMIYPESSAYSTLNSEY